MSTAAAVVIVAVVINNHKCLTELSTHYTHSDWLYF